MLLHQKYSQAKIITTKALKSQSTNPLKSTTSKLEISSISHAWWADNILDNNRTRLKTTRYIYVQGEDIFKPSRINVRPLRQRFHIFELLIPKMFLAQRFFWL
jgi:hypothetical protein